MTRQPLSVTWAGVALLIVIVAACGTRTSDPEARHDTAARPVPSDMRSADVLAFGPNGVLFIGDSKGSALYAMATPDTVDTRYARDTTSAFFNVYGVERKIAGVLGVPIDELTINDLAVHPASHIAYLAVTRSTGAAAQPAIVTVNRQGDVRLVDVAAAHPQRMPLKNPLPEQPGMAVGRIPPENLTITDIVYHDGAVYISGLTNGAFRSTLRRVRYPFADGPSEDAYIEMYHTVHNRNETKAPINKFTVLDLNGEPTVVAAYTCTPLVTIPVRALANGAKISGKTVAEIGFASIPSDMVSYVESTPDGKKRPVLLVTDKQRSAALFALDDVAAASRGPGMTKPSMFDPAGVPYRPLPLAGVLRIDNQDDQLLLTLRRNIDTGEYDLLSWRKGMYIRASDFVNGMGLEHYPGNDPMQRQLEANVQRMARDEGLPISPDTRQ
ncbi:MAG: hypothetical protein ACJ79K_05015 [Gemmatimonadaceae bacterium]